jgi:uncharacterized coiled-coil DUF342 family protein
MFSNRNSEVKYTKLQNNDSDDEDSTHVNIYVFDQDGNSIFYSNPFNAIVNILDRAYLIASVTFNNNCLLRVLNTSFQIKFENCINGKYFKDNFQSFDFSLKDILLGNLIDSNNNPNEELKNYFNGYKNNYGKYINIIVSNFSKYYDILNDNSISNNTENTENNEYYEKIINEYKRKNNELYKISNELLSRFNNLANKINNNDNNNDDNNTDDSCSTNDNGDDRNDRDDGDDGEHSDYGDDSSDGDIGHDGDEGDDGGESIIYEISSDDSDSEPGHRFSESKTENSPRKHDHLVAKELVFENSDERKKKFDADIYAYKLMKKDMKKLKKNLKNAKKKFNEKKKERQDLKKYIQSLNHNDKENFELIKKLKDQINEISKEETELNNDFIKKETKYKKYGNDITKFSGPLFKDKASIFRFMDNNDYIDRDDALEIFYELLDVIYNEKTPSEKYDDIIEEYIENCDIQPSSKKYLKDDNNWDEYI